MSVWRAVSWRHPFLCQRPPGEVVTLTTAKILTNVIVSIDVDTREQQNSNGSPPWTSENVVLLKFFLQALLQNCSMGHNWGWMFFLFRSDFLDMWKTTMPRGELEGLVDFADGGEAIIVICISAWSSYSHKCQSGSFTQCDLVCTSSGRTRYHDRVHCPCYNENSNDCDDRELTNSVAPP